VIFTIKKTKYSTKSKTACLFFGIKLFVRIKTSTAKYYILPGFVVRFNNTNSDAARAKRFRETAPEDYAKFFAEIAPQNPKTLNEKIKWLGIYDATPLKTLCADKYLARQWVAEQVGEQYLIPLLGVWDSFDEIDFASLPDQFVLKCNHGSGWNVAVPDKRTFDRAAAKRKFDLWMRKNLAFTCFELQYLDIQPKIIAEKFLRQEDGSRLSDYRFHVFHGKPEFIRKTITTPEGHPGLSYTPSWEITPFQFISHPLADPIPKPRCLDEMLAVAVQLAAPFCFVRVDLYEVGGRVYFGEMTFTPVSGRHKFNHPKYDGILGDMLNLPEARIYQPRP